MRRALLTVGLCLAAAVAHADAGLHVLSGGGRNEYGAALFAGYESAGVNVWLDREDLNRSVSVAYVHRWRGFETSTDRYRPLLSSPHAALYLRDFSNVDYTTERGTALGFGFGGGLSGKLGTPTGSFSLVLGPTLAAQGFWVVREGTHGLNARFPVGVDLGVEARFGHWAPFGLVRPVVDLFPGRSPAYRFEVGIGVGYWFEPPQAEPGKPRPPGP